MRCSSNRKNINTRECVSDANLDGPVSENGAETEEVHAASSTDTKSNLFYCPEEGCTKAFIHHGDLINHTEYGKHSYVPMRITLRDKCIQLYKEQLEGIFVNPLVNDAAAVLETLLDDQQGQCEERPKLGWALPKKRKSGNFNADQREFLITAFNEGERLKRKLDPKTFAKQMRKAKNPNGEQRFSPDEFLTWQQISSFWTRLHHARTAAALRLAENQSHQTEPTIMRENRS